MAGVRRVASAVAVRKVQPGNIGHAWLGMFDGGLGAVGVVLVEQ